MARRAVVLLSGGLDSATTLAVAREEGYECFALSFDYGQRHAVELEAARRVVAAGGAVEHRVVRLDLAALGGSALTEPADNFQARWRALREAGPMPVQGLRVSSS